MAGMIAKMLKEKRAGAKTDQALRKILNYLDYNKNFKIRLEDFIDIMEEHEVDLKPEEILELCELTEETGEICQSTLTIFVKNSNVWKVLERQNSQETNSQACKGKTKIEIISFKANRVHAAFNVLDSDRDGFVSKQDFRKKFVNLNTSQIDIVFNKYDRSSNGKMSFVEFKNFMSRRPLPMNLESRRNSILSLPAYSSLSSSAPPRYSSLSLYPPRYSSLDESQENSLTEQHSFGNNNNEARKVCKNISKDFLISISPESGSTENEVDILSFIAEEGVEGSKHDIVEDEG